MIEELITQVDEKDNIIGLKPRSAFNSGKLIHRSAYLLLFNSKEELLLLKRPQWKKWHPRLWSYSVTGSVGDESYEDCMKRKIKENFKQSFPFRELFKYYHFDSVDKAFKAVYISKIGKEFIDYIQNKTQAFRWISIVELRKELKEHPEKFAPPFISGMKIYFKQRADSNVI